MKKYKLSEILFPLISCLLIFALLVFSFFNLTNIFALYSKLDTYNANIDTYNSNIAKLSSVSTDDLQNALNTFDTTIPNGGDVANLVNNTIILAHSFGLQAQTDTTKQDKTKNQQSVSVQDLQSGDLEVIPPSILIDGIIYPINLTMSLSGTKENIMSFITNVSQQKRIQNIENLKLEKITNTNGTTVNSWTASVTIIAYALVDQKTDSRRVTPITDPEDPKLLNPVKSVNTAF